MTRALDDASGRISRFLIRQLLLNGAFGLIIGLGLFVIGVPYAFLFGFLAGLLRYVPYLGAWLAALLPAALALAVFPDWMPLVWVLVLFTVVELAFSNFLEPSVYGRSIGVSAVALLVAAVFWTWLWGPVGLLLTTPLTACLAVAGRYLPYFEFLDVLLGDQPVLERYVAYFQRLVARDQDEATDIVEAYLKDHPPEHAYDELLVPALVLTKSNFHRGELSKRDVRFICQATYNIVVETVTPERHQQEPAASDGPLEKLGEPACSPIVLGVPARDEVDHIALHMVDQLLEDAPCRLQILSHRTKAADLLAAVRRHEPAAVCILALPPGGVTNARALCRRLRISFPNLRLLVGCGSRDPQALERLRAQCDEVVPTLHALRDRVRDILEHSATAERRVAVEV